MQRIIFHPLCVFFGLSDPTSEISKELLSSSHSACLAKLVTSRLVAWWNISSQDGLVSTKENVNKRTWEPPKGAKGILLLKAHVLQMLSKWLQVEKNCVFWCSNMCHRDKVYRCNCQVGHRRSPITNSLVISSASGGCFLKSLCINHLFPPDGRWWLFICTDLATARQIFRNLRAWTWHLCGGFRFFTQAKKRMLVQFFLNTWLGVVIWSVDVSRKWCFVLRHYSQLIHAFQHTFKLQLGPPNVARSLPSCSLGAWRWMSNDNFEMALQYHNISYGSGPHMFTRSHKL